MDAPPRVTPAGVGSRNALDTLARVPATLHWSRFGAVLFDLDGVITPTAAIHERAWGELFADRGYTRADYLDHIDGKPRHDGVRRNDSIS